MVGSGPGGALTAALLAEAGRDVVLIEEGRRLAPESCPAFSLVEVLQKYRNGGVTVAMGRARITYAEGRVVGGGSEINSALFHRLPSAVLDRWRQDFHTEHLTEQELQSHFAACEQELTVGRAPGGAEMPARKLAAGAQAEGLTCFEVPRMCGYPVEESPREGIKQTMSRTYIPRFLKAGGRLIAETKATRIRRDGTDWRVEAVTARHKPCAIRAHTLFLACGAVGTPALLRRSGLGAHVGDSLGLHPTVKLVAEFPEAVNAEGMGVPAHQVKDAAQGLSFGCSISSPPHLAMALLGHPECLRRVNDSWRNMAVFYAMTPSAVSGSVRTVPGFFDPVVRYPVSENDLRELAKGLCRLAQLLFAAGAKRLYPVVTGMRELRGPGDLRSLPKVLAGELAGLMTVHLFSTCPMGEKRAACTADSFGRVFGHKNLHIADASLLCGPPGVNPQGAIMAIARRNALAHLGKL